MKLADYSQDKQNAMPYTKLCLLRREAYEEFVSQMTVRDEIKDWSRKMEFRHVNGGEYEAWCDRNAIMPDDEHKIRWAKTIGVWVNRVSLISGLLIVRYGEEPKHWPTTFTDLDVERARKWLEEGKIPGAVISAIKRGV